MTLDAKVSMSWVRTVLGAAQRQGVDETTLLRAAGIPLQDLKLERWPIDHITRLWRAATRLTQDTSFGLKAGTLVSPASFNVVGFIVQSAATLRQALAVVQKYQSLVSDGGRFQLLAGPHNSWLVYHPRQGDLAFSPHQIEAVLAAVVSASGWITPQPLKPTLVRFSHEAVGRLSGYREAFACPIEFNQAYSGLLIDNTVLDQPLPQANAQLARLHEQYAAAQLQAQAQELGLDEAVRTWLQEQMASGARTAAPTRAEAAIAFGLGERTLARRLSDHGTHFNALLDQARQELALQWLTANERTVREVAMHLGFAELSPFYRAFQRWTGCSPRAWQLDRCSDSTRNFPSLPPVH